jgi:hypothetical protein
MLPELKRVFDEQGRQLVLRGNRGRSPLAAVGASEIRSLPLGVHPAIEASGFAVLELRDRRGVLNLCHKCARQPSRKLMRRV